MKLLLWKIGSGWDSQYNRYNSARGMISSQGGRITDILGLDVVIIPLDSRVVLVGEGFPLALTLNELSKSSVLGCKGDSYPR